ncbi:MAG: DegT/DnrJ/EryC1/StrS family aminotransferase [Muribaculaceae bacterium]|nr:DegT/DnrJ/EryC1/StrS family aminotransferase [Muribaculaceae bacterium]
MNIPFLDLGRLNAPYMDDINRALLRVAASGRYVGGEEVARFESELGDYLVRQYVIGVSNGLDALRLILEGYKRLGRMKDGDEVIVPANTYIATILAIEAAGLRPVAVEPSEETLNIDSELIERSITPRTRAIMTVHLYGRVAWDAAMADIADRYGLLVIEDNAQGLGSRSQLPGRSGSIMAGALGDAAALSFYPTKNLGAMGDAGAVATDDEELAKAVRALANYGSDRRYHNIYRGFNCRLDPVQAAVLSAKLHGLDRDNDRRREIAAIYDAKISNPRVRLHRINPQSQTNYHQYVISVDGDREEFRRLLSQAGVATDVHYAVPPHLQPCYEGELGGPYPITEKIARQVVSLPIAPYLTDAEAEYVATVINSVRLS